MNMIEGLVNHQVRLAARPNGLPRASDWNHTTEGVPRPGPGGFVAKTLMLSLDPAMRGWMNDARSYIAPVGIGEVMRAGGIGQVIASDAPQFPEGSFISAALGIQEYCSVDAASVRQLGVQRVDLTLAPAEKWLNSLGMPGMTAYFGLLDVGQPKPGETVVISGAAGAVGQTVGQIAKQKGCRAVGIAGGPAKCAFVVNELGFDACIDYKSQVLKDELKRHCPDGVDVYFDNVGGEILNTVLTRIARGARIVICGAISQYNNTMAVAGPSNYLSLLVNRARMEGMVVFDYTARFPEAINEMAGWMQAGKLHSREDIVDGLERFPETLLKLFSGENFGKLILRVSTPA